MIAVPIGLALFGYWVLYAGLKGTSLADAYRCASQQRQTPGDQSGRQGFVQLGPGTVKVGPAVVTTDCTVRKGDTKLPIPGTNRYMIWRPIGSGWFGQLNGQLLGPCGS